ncbi:hypothetical protein BHK69_30610 (plasmid) [Bosea vaviloviae]|uniref:Uncharacterized protein n=1 Tax=Bosea vaviloviae TaxID=1526658 RepID=A0A1D7UCG7_9HYPH|nr:hypothetical protein BHK69_30610 [Bosea vaviloviae]
MPDLWRQDWDRSQIELVDEDIHHPNRINFADVILKTVGQELLLLPVLAFDVARHASPRITHGIIRISHFFFAFGHPTSTIKAKSGS